jgi:hypothetical protein
MSEPTTQPADPIIASTPEPASESFEQVLNRQINQKPKIERVDYSKVESGEQVPQSIEEITSMESDEFLKHLDGVESTPEEPKKEKKTKEKATEKTASNDSFDLSDLDLAKDPEPVEAPKKKSKEDNIAELRKKAEAYEASLKEKDTEVTSYRDKLEKLEAELERTAFERSPKFKEKYEQPYSEAIDKASTFAKEIGDDQSIAEKALALKGKERIEFIDESFGGGAAAAQFLNLINDADGKRGNLEGALENYRQTNQDLQVEQQKNHQQFMESAKKNFDRVAAHLANKNELFREIGDEDHDKAVRSRREAAEAIMMGTASSNDMALTPFLAVAAKDAIEKLAKVEAELAKYKNRAKEDASVQARISRSSSDEETTTKGSPKSGLDSIRSQLRGL